MTSTENKFAPFQNYNCFLYWTTPFCFLMCVQTPHYCTLIIAQCPLWAWLNKRCCADMMGDDAAVYEKGRATQTAGGRGRWCTDKEEGAV